MPIICDNSGCQYKVDNSHFIGVSFRDLTKVVSSDCSRNFVFFTDDPGVINTNSASYNLWDSTIEYAKGSVIKGADDKVYQSLVDGNLDSDPVSSSVDWTSKYLASEVLLTKQNVFSLPDVSTHWQECSRTYQKLSFFFNISKGRGQRGSSIVVAYRDPSESWEDAYNRLTECFTCFRWVGHVDIGADGATLYADQPEQISFATLLRSERKIPMFPTFDEVNLKTSFSEIVTTPGKSGSTNVGAAWFLAYQNDNCTYQCEDQPQSTISKPWYQPNDVMAAAVASSYGFTDTSYNWTLYMKPPKGWPGAKTHELTRNEIINITGVSPDTGFLNDAARSVNVYVASQAGTSGFLEGMTDDGYFIDDIAKRYAIEEDLIKTILEYQHSTEDAILTSESDLLSLDNLMTQKARTYINKGMVLDKLPDTLDLDSNPEYKWSNSYDNIIAGGDGFGWVLARRPLEEFSDGELSQRFGVVYEFCFISNRPLHRARINACSTIKPSQIA